MEFTTTERGARKLIRNGYIYLFKKNLANGSSWECELRRSGQCRASIKLDEAEDFLAEVNQHTHAPSDIKCETAKVKANIKRRATDTLDPPRNIIVAEVGACADAVAVNLPLLQNMQRNIRRQRQARHEFPNPVAIEAIPEIPQQFCTTITGEQFLVYDSGFGNDDRILMFAGTTAI